MTDAATSFEVTPRTRVRRHPERAAYDRDLVNSIFDEGLICHLGFSVDGKPVVIPTMYARSGDRLFVHGSPASRMLKTLRGGVEVSICVTILDGLVMARSAFHHSMNYRSVVVFGRAKEVIEPARKQAAFKALVDQVAPGRWDDARQPSPKELKATVVLELALNEVSAKVRSGPPLDSDDDLELPVWAGVVPLRITAQPQVDAPDLAPGIPAPRYAIDYRRQAGRANA